MTVDELLSAARSGLQRLDPVAASDAVAADGTNSPGPTGAFALSGEAPGKR